MQIKIKPIKKKKKEHKKENKFMGTIT